MSQKSVFVNPSLYAEGSMKNLLVIGVSKKMFTRAKVGRTLLSSIPDPDPDPKYGNFF
jgi:hypothetical protein